MAQTKIAKYDVIKLLRQEPTGEVYLAEDRSEGRQLVVQLLPSGGAGVDQARRVAALTHASVGWASVGLHGNTPYLATEYFDAPSLEEWLQQNPSFGDRIRMVAALADALCYIQEQGVVHGALEPSVVKVMGDGDVRLVDFAVGATRAPQSPASVASRAPEVLQGEPYTRQSETHTAAVLFYQILAGVNPFTRPNAAASREAVLNEHPAAISDVRREVPRDLSDAIMACLEKDPEWRPKDLSYVLEVARQAAAQAKPSGKPVARKAAAPAPRPAAPEPGSLPSFGARPRQSAPSGGGRGLMIGAVALVLVGAGVGIWFWLGSRPAPTKSAQGPAPTQPPVTAAPVETLPPETAPPASAPARGEDKGKVRERVPEVTQPTPPPVTAPPTTQAAAPTPPPTTTPPRPTPPPPSTPPPTTLPPQPAATTLAPAPPAVPATLTTVVPPTIKRAARTLIDVRGTGIRRDHRVVVLRGKEVAAGITVGGQKLDNATLLKVMLVVDGAAAPGFYSVALIDPQGEVTNALRLEVAK